MMEVAVVVDKQGSAIHWHVPEGRSSCAIPDSRGLWEILYENRDVIQGVAHSHPGVGIPGPSHTDVTTFAAIEAGLGRRLDWWITSSNAMVVCRWAGPDRLSYTSILLTVEPFWADKLRELSDGCGAEDLPEEDVVISRLLNARRAVMGFLTGVGPRPTEEEINTIRKGWGM